MAYSEKQKHVLQSIFLFRDIEEAALCQYLQSLPEPVNYGKGEIVYNYENFDRCIGVVLSGELQVCQVADDRRVQINRLSAGSLFGVAALFGECETYVSEITASKSCRIAFLSQEWISDLMKQDFRIAENYIRFLSDRIRFLNRRIVSFTGGQTENRVLQYLLERKNEDGSVNMPRSMVEMANTLNMGRSSLYRSLDTLEKSGMIKRVGKSMVFVENIME